MYAICGDKDGESQRRRNLRGGLLMRYLVVLLMFCMTAAHAAEGASNSQYSDAQIALFHTPHLDNVGQPTILHYDYRHEAEPVDSFADTVTMTVTQIADDGGKTVTFGYLTGSHERSFEDVAGFRGNPLIMIFLEDDVRRMKEKFGGGGVYLRNRIRHAFYEGAVIRPVTFDLNGRRVDGTQVTVTPFVGDKNRARLGEFEHKIYEFVISPEVPGGVFQMRSTVPSPSAAARPLIRETLTYRDSGPRPDGGSSD